MDLVLAAWRARGFIAGSVVREFSTRYRSSLFGAAWAVITPLSMVAVYLVVFSQLMHARLPGSTGALDYGVFLCAGVLTWGFFAEIVQRSMTMFLDNAGLIKKMSFPRVCLPIIVVVNATMNFAIVYLLFVLILAITGSFPGRYLLAVPGIMLVLCLIGSGIGIIAGVLNVFFRDIGQVLGIVLQLWFWLTPIVYPLSILPPEIAPIVAANPLTPLIVAQQHAALGAGWPEWHTFLQPAIVGIVVAILALALFRRRSFEIVDEL
jgi:lipopolysaccharide transport system permease protein